MPYQYKYTPAGKWPRKKLAKLVRLYLGGRSFEQLQPVFRCTAHTLRTYFYANPVAYEIRKQHPRKHGPRFWTDERHKQLLTMMYGEGKTKEECERFFGSKKLNLYLFYSKEARRLLRILGLRPEKDPAPEAGRSALWSTTCGKAGSTAAMRQGSHLLDLPLHVRTAAGYFRSEFDPGSHTFLRKSSGDRQG